jgi:hypothetical protein
MDGCSEIDGFAIHTYSRGADPSSITDPKKMDPPWDKYYNGFQTYKDWLEAIPTQYKDREIHISETDQDDAWLDEPNTWVQAAYAEINKHNEIEGTQKICSMVLYRWPKSDKFYIEGLGNVYNDIKAAVAKGYTWTDKEDPPVSEEWNVVYQNPCEDYHYWGETPQIKVLDGWIVNWDPSMPRPEMDFKYDPQPEVCPWNHPRSGVGFHINTKFDWWMRTEEAISIGAGLRTKMVMGLMVAAHGFEGAPDKLGDCGMLIGISSPDITDVHSDEIVWCEWWTVREPGTPGANLKEYEWIVAETPEIIPQVGQVVLWIRCVANVAADISAGHFDDIQIQQFGGTPTPPVGNHTITTITITQLDGTEISRSESEAQITCGDVDPEACALAQQLAGMLCPST